jgi:hypothetical protein
MNTLNSLSNKSRAKHNPHLRPDVIYSLGINCIDADAIIVHIVLHEFYQRVRSELHMSQLSLPSSSPARGEEMPLFTFS